MSPNDHGCARPMRSDWCRTCKGSRQGHKGDFSLLRSVCRIFLPLSPRPQPPTPKMHSTLGIRKPFNLPRGWGKGSPRSSVTGQQRANRTTNPFLEWLFHVSLAVSHCSQICILAPVIKCQLTTCLILDSAIPCLLSTGLPPLSR